MYRPFKVQKNGRIDVLKGLCFTIGISLWCKQVHSCDLSRTTKIMPFMQSTNAYKPNKGSM